MIVSNVFIMWLITFILLFLQVCTFFIMNKHTSAHFLIPQISSSSKILFDSFIRTSTALITVAMVTQSPDSSSQPPRLYLNPSLKFSQQSSFFSFLHLFRLCSPLLLHHQSRPAFNHPMLSLMGPNGGQFDHRKIKVRKCKNSINSHSLTLGMSLILMLRFNDQ